MSSSSCSSLGLLLLTSVSVFVRFFLQCCRIILWSLSYNFSECVIIESTTSQLCRGVGSLTHWSASKPSVKKVLTFSLTAFKTPFSWMFSAKQTFCTVRNSSTFVIAVTQTLECHFLAGLALFTFSWWLLMLPYPKKQAFKQELCMLQNLLASVVWFYWDFQFLLVLVDYDVISFLRLKEAINI